MISSLQNQIKYKHTGTAGGTSTGSTSRHCIALQSHSRKVQAGDVGARETQGASPPPRHSSSPAHFSNKSHSNRRSQQSSFTPELRSSSGVWAFEGQVSTEYLKSPLWHKDRGTTGDDHDLAFSEKSSQLRVEQQL